MPLLVVDARSCDRTEQFARARGAEFVQRDWHGFVEARRFALTHVRTPWMLALDADEALDDRLCDAILAADGSPSGYAVARDTYYCGKPLRMWRGERLLRLVRTASARVEAFPAAGGAAELHERYECDGRVDTLDGTLLHFSYDNADAYRAKYARYTTLEAASLRPSFVLFARALIVSALRFPWLLFVRGAILDGRYGIAVAWWSALYPAMVRWKALRNR
jgi:glycosyltransferase involved in cell wall biosynthesis